MQDQPRNTPAVSAATPAASGPPVWVEGEGTPVRTVWINRAAKANSLTAEMMESLAAAAAAGAGDDVMVLRSASARLFCAGADIAEFCAGGDSLARQEHALMALIGGLAQCQSPIVTIARGKASGAGAILLALSDVVIGAGDLEVACPEIRFGMFPIIVEAVLQSRLPHSLATRLCLTGEPLAAAEAVRFGLVTEILPPEGFDAASQERLAGYLECVAALRIARSSRMRLHPPASLIERVRRVAPLMAENYERPGVRAKIQSYLAALGQKR